MIVGVLRCEGKWSQGIKRNLDINLNLASDTYAQIRKYLVRPRLGGRCRFCLCIHPRHLQ